MKRFPTATTATALTLLLGLAACAAENGNDAELETATTDGEAAALEKAIEPGDFEELELGAKIEGPQGPEVQAALLADGTVMAEMTSYVACPADMEECDPQNAPEDTLYTYVHTVFPGEDNDPSAGAGEGPDDADIENAESFVMTAPAHGFTGEAGFSKASAIAAAGEEVDVVITCGNDGALVWTVNAGDGGDQWEDAEPITFFWQSTLPPQGPAASYAIIANGVSAAGEGPYPTASDTAINACIQSSTDG